MNNPLISSNSLLKIYPNPVTGLLQIEALGMVDKIELYHITGSRQKVSQVQQNNKVELDLSLQKQGIYIVKVEYSDGSFQLEKIVKK